MNKILTNIFVVAATVVSVYASNYDNPVASSSTATVQNEAGFNFSSFTKYPSYLSIDKEKVSAINAFLKEQNINDYAGFSGLASQVVRASKLITATENAPINITNAKVVDAIYGLLKLSKIYNGDFAELTNKVTNNTEVNNTTQLMFDAFLMNADKVNSKAEVDHVIGKIRSLTSLFVKENGTVNNFHYSSYDNSLKNLESAIFGDIDTFVVANRFLQSLELLDNKDFIQENAIIIISILENLLEYGKYDAKSLSDIKNTVIAKILDNKVNRVSDLLNAISFTLSYVNSINNSPDLGIEAVTINNNISSVYVDNIKKLFAEK